MENHSDSEQGSKKPSSDLQELLDICARIFSARTSKGLLENIVDAACELTEGKFSISYYNLRDPSSVEFAGSKGDDVPSSLPGRIFSEEGERGLLDLVEREKSIRLSRAKLENFPISWWRMPKGSTPVKELLGAPLVNCSGQVEGMVLVFDKIESEFSEEDEHLLKQFAYLSSLKLQHLEKGAKAEEQGKTLEAIMTYVPVGITVADAPDVNIRMVSKHGQDLTRRPEDDLVGIRYDVHAEKWSVLQSDGITPAGSEELPLTRATLNGEEVKNEEWVLQRPDGSKFPVLCNAGPIVDEAGRITGGIIAWHDISELKNALQDLQKSRDELEKKVAERTAELVRVNEKLKATVRKREQLAESLQLEIKERKRVIEDLRRSEETYSTLLQNLPGVAYRGFADWSVEFVDEKLESLTGYPAEVFNSKGMKWCDLLAKEDFERTEAALVEALKTDLSFIREYRIKAKDGRIIWIQDRGKITLTEQGRIDYISGVFFDVTEHKLLDMQIEEERDKLRTLIESITDEVWFCDTEGNLSLVNMAALREFGFERVEDACQPLPEWLTQLEIFTPDGRPRAQEDAPLFRSLRGETLKDFEEMVRHPETGRVMYRQVSSAPLKSEAGDIMGAVAVVRDITERKNLDKDLTDNQRQLRSMALELVLTEERERRKLAEDLHDSIGQHLALSKLRIDTLSHGKRAGKISPELESVSKTLDSAIEQTQSLIFKLSPPVLYQVGLTAALEYLAESVGKENGISISVDSEIDGPVLPEKIAVLLFRAVQELLTNTVKHSEASNSSITLRGSDDHVYVEVQDDGIGFDLQLLEAEGSAKDRYGLFSIRERLYHLGANIQVDSAPGRGTKIMMTVPLLTEAETT